MNERFMKFRFIGWIVWLFWISAAALLAALAQNASADGGGWPTATPAADQAQPTAQVIIAPSIQGDAPLPNPDEAQPITQPATAIQDGQAVMDAAPKPDAATRSNDTRRLLIFGGGIVVIVLLVGFVVFRLRG